MDDSGRRFRRPTWHNLPDCHEHPDDSSAT
jgi:hypothetical protein